jgi:hypothetical protein
MATTTNFGWETPDDTDLVKDGAAAMRTLGNSIDTSFVDLKGGTTGQILSKNSNTDLDYLWITNDVGDITAVTAGTGISGGGTSGAVTITNSMATAMTAKGDLIVATGSGTFAAQAVGANGTVLTANSAQADGVEWVAPASGGMTLISTTTLSGTSITISSIPQTYNHLQLVVTGFVPGTNQHYQAFDFYTGSSSSVGGYDLYQIDSISTSNTATAGSGKYYTTRTAAPGWSNSSNSTSHSIINVFDYTRTGVMHVINSTTSYTDGNGVKRTSFNFANSNNTGAINAVNVSTGLSGTISGTVYLYGVK